MLKQSFQAKTCNMSAYFETVKKLQAAARRCSLKNLRLKFNKIYKKTPAPKFLFWWSCKLEACNFIKNRLQHRCFPVDFEKFSTTHILKNTYGRLLLKNEQVFTHSLAKLLYVWSLWNTVVVCFRNTWYFKWKPSISIEILSISIKNLRFRSKYKVSE